MNAEATPSSFLLPAASLWRREILRFVRARSRVIGALATPFVFWILIGSGLRDSFRIPGATASVNYLEYALPGTMVLIVLFTAVFATISVIEDRKAGFLQAVIASPVRRSAIAMGKIFGCSTLATAQALIFLLLAPLLGIPLSATATLLSAGVLLLVSVGLSALGLLGAWYMDSTQGFHAIMNLVLFPLWLLSGAFFPPSGAASWIGWIMSVNPMTYGVAALRHAMYPDGRDWGPGVPSFGLSIVITILFAVAMTALATNAVKRRE